MWRPVVLCYGRRRLHVALVDPNLEVLLTRHGDARQGARYSLRTCHHLAQSILYGLARAKSVIMRGGKGLKKATESAHLALQSGGDLATPPAAIEKGQRLEEILIVISVPGFIAGERQHAIGRGRTQQGLERESDGEGTSGSMRVY